MFVSEKSVSKGIDLILIYCLGRVQATMLDSKHSTSSKTCPKCPKMYLLEGCA